MGFFNKLGSAVSSVLGSTGIPIVEDIGAGLQSYFGQELAEDQLKNEQNFNAYQAQLNRDFQREEREATQDFNLMMWEKNNEYNSPAAQLQRAKDAGINPNAVLGNSVASPPVTSSPMSGSAASSSASIASSLLLQDAQLANLMAQARKTNSDADINEQEYAYNNVTFADRVNSLRYANEETKARLNKIISDTDIQQKTFEIFARKSEEELNALREQVNKIRVEIDNARKQGNILDKQGTLLDKQIDNQDIQNSLSRLQLQFSAASGVPAGTPIDEALWKTVVNGEFDSLVDIFIQNVEDYGKSQLNRIEGYARKAVGDKAVDVGKRVGKRAYKKMQDVMNYVADFFSIYNP